MSKVDKYIIGGVAVVVLLFGAFLVKGNKTENKSPIPTLLPSPLPPSEKSPSPTTSPSGTIYVKEVKTMDGLIIQDITIGTGAEAVSGKKITVNYAGTLTDGTKFDSSYDRGTPFSFTLGAGEVIKGWDQGFAGMKVGGKRKLTIPPELGYGAAGAGGVIGPNATLIFEVELLGVN